MHSLGLAKSEKSTPQLRQPTVDGQPRLIARPPETPVQVVANILRRHFWTIVACTTISTSLFLLYAARQPRLFRATANLAIYRDSNPAGGLSKDYSPEAADTDEYTVSLQTQLRILQSRSLALDVVRKLGLDRDAGFISHHRVNSAMPAEA